MASPIDNRIAEVKVRRYGDSTACDIVVQVGGQEMVLSCRDYSQAVKWARVECKAYGIVAISVERASKIGDSSGIVR